MPPASSRGLRSDAPSSSRLTRSHRRFQELASFTVRARQPRRGALPPSRHTHCQATRGMSLSGTNAKSRRALKLSSGKTGSHRRTARTTRLTLLRDSRQADVSASLCAISPRAFREPDDHLNVVKKPEFQAAQYAAFRGRRTWIPRRFS